MVSTGSDADAGRVEVRGLPYGRELGVYGLR